MLRLEILTSHLTDKEKIITLRFRNITLASIIVILSFANITLCSSSIFNNSNVSALDYSSNVGIGFTFNPTLSISLSSNDLVIPNLVPGSIEDSNSVNVSVATNAAYGYTLSATVGDSTHNNSNLTHSNNTNVFSSIATDSNLPSLTTDNTWGYSYKNNLASTPTWSSYSGLATNINKVLFNTDSNTTSSIDFKITAKASPTQSSGMYTGTINFIAISKPIPRTIEDIAYMQTFGELNPTDLQTVKDSMLQEHTYILKDARDEQEYTIAKLNDNKIWMTKNLNLAGDTEITSELSDVSENYTLPTANGFQEGNKLPASSQEGFSDNTQAYVYNTGNDTDNCASPGCYSYYSWNAATAGSGANLTTYNIDAPYSICPKGWRLPTVRRFSIDYDFYYLAIAYGMNPNNTSDSSSETGSNFYNLAGPDTIPDFLLSGMVQNGEFTQANSFGYSWSCTSNNVERSFYLSFRKTNVNTADNYLRAYGAPIRCLAK